MKIQLHETLNSIGVLTSLALSIYAAALAYENQRESITITATPTIISWENAKSCDKPLASKWLITLTNLSERSAAVTRLRFVTEIKYDRSAGLPDTRVYEMPGPPPRSDDSISVEGANIPINLNANSSAAFALLYSRKRNYGEEEYCKCGGPGCPRPLPAEVYIELTSSTDHRYFLTLQMPYGDYRDNESLGY